MICVCIVCICVCVARVKMRGRVVCLLFSSVFCRQSPCKSSGITAACAPIWCDVGSRHANSGT